jgi:hypothetical protein
MAVRGCGMHNGGQALCNGLHCLEVNIRRVNMVHQVCAYMSERDAKEGHVRFACKNTSEHIAK